VIFNFDDLIAFFSSAASMMPDLSVSIYSKVILKSAISFESKILTNMISADFLNLETPLNFLI